MILPIALASVPGLFALLAGHRLVRHLSDPSFADLLQAHRARLQILLIATVVAGALLVEGFGLWHVPLAVLGAMLGGFPARRRIFDESWTVLAFLSHVARVATAFFGAILPLLAAPALVIAFPDAYGPIVAASVLLSAAIAYSSSFALRLLGTRPLENGPWSEGFDEVVSRSVVETPELLVAETPGGHWVNAFAFPHPRRRAVVFARGLLDGLAPDETVGIFAHEVAHLEEFTPKRWFVRASPLPLATLIQAIVIGIIGPGSDALVWIGALLPWILLGLLGAVVQGVRKRETDSDLRAVELTEDPDLLIRALEKLHALNHQPRRLASNVEQRSTHPSLARRAQAIRSARESEAPTAHDADLRLVLRNADDPRRALRLYHDRIEWFEDLPLEDGDIDDLELETASMVAAFPYEKLTELRLHAKRSGRRWLIATREDGDSQKFPVHVEDAERVQQFLDIIDHRLSAALKTARANWYASASFVRLTAAIALFLAVTTLRDWAPLLTSALALIWPLAFNLAVGGGTLLVSFLAAFARGDLDQSRSALPAIVAVFGLCMWAVAVLRIQRGKGDPVRAWRRSALLLGAVGAVGIALTIAASSGATQVMDLHLWARGLPSSLVLLAGVALGLLTRKARRDRLEGALMLGFVALWLPLGSNAFRTGFSSDALRGPGPRVDVQPEALRPERELTLDRWPAALHVSPSGHRIAALASLPAADSSAMNAWETLTFLVEREDSWVQVPGEQLGWQSDDRVVTARWSNEHYVVRETDLDDASFREDTIAIDLDPVLAVEGEVWSLWAIDAAGRLKRYRRNAQGGLIEEETWEMPAPDGGTLDEVASASTRSALLIRSPALWSQPNLWSALTTALGVGRRSQVWLADDRGMYRKGETAFTLQCSADDVGRHLCASGRDGQGEFWAFHTGQVDPESLGRIRGWQEPSWMPEGSMALQSIERAPLLLGGAPFSVREALTPPTEGTSAWWNDVAAVGYRGEVVAFARWGTADDFTITVYRTSP